MEGSDDLDYTAPRRQLVVNLTGSVDLTVGDGTVRRLAAGEILLAEDLTGRGQHQRGRRGAYVSFHSPGR